MFPEIFGQESTEYGEEKHDEFPEIMRPFFSGGMSMLMYFHGAEVDEL